LSALIVKKVAILGAGVMGAQIAAHLANADVAVLLFDLASPQGDASALAKKAIDALKKMTPAPFINRDRVNYIDAANYDEHLHLLAECDIVIEAIAEKMEWKEDLYRKIAPHIKPGAIVASNTSGLSINQLSENLPAQLRAQFCGIHFFNPPRYMRLVEIIATKTSSAAMLDQLETWLTKLLGKGVVRAKDTSSFVANRIGVFSMLIVMHHAQRLGLGCDVVDELTGTKIGRGKSATFRTADLIGLDTLKLIVNTLRDTLPDDPWHSYFALPKWVEGLIDKGALGLKTKAGVFTKVGKDIQVFDPIKQEYKASTGTIAPEIAALLKIADPAQRMAALRADVHPQAQLVWSVFRDLFHYSAYHLAGIADNARDMDFAMRWGYGWSQGPFESWQAAGWQAVASAIQTDIANGKTMSNAPLPSWVLSRDGVHEAAGSWSAAESVLKPRSNLPVYQRQLYPEHVLGEAVDIAGNTVWESEGVRLWTHPLDAGIAIISLKTKMHAIGTPELEGVLSAVAMAEKSFDGLVMWQEAPFSVGANLKEFLADSQAGCFEALDQMLIKFQQASMALKYAQVPTVAAVEGLALGGGCELMMHASHRVLALESYIGLVEPSVGLIPAGGGSKEIALRAAEMVKCQSGVEVLSSIQAAFQTISNAKKSGSAIEAIEMGFAKASDDIVFHPKELLYVAIRRARAMAEANYRPPLQARNVVVAGRVGIATLEMALLNLKEGGFISAHDYKVSRAVAVALCGGEVEKGTQVSEQWLLDVERREFIALLKTPETQARIQHTLDTGKPLKN
jgi:3-hydroxyacyl-CoA dehydrogenase